MPLAYLLDENLRGRLWQHIGRHNVGSAHVLDVVRVGDAGAPPLRTRDSDILLWAEQEKRIVLSRDERTMPEHLTAHLAAGHRSPGVFLLRVVPLVTIIDFLACAAYASDAAEWADRVTFVP